MGRQPTPAELAVLNVIWEQGPVTVRQVHTELKQSKPMGYTTVLKIMQIMHKKGLVKRDEGARAHIYTATSGAHSTRGQLLRDMVKRAFGGSRSGLILHALEEDVSAQEIAEIRKVLDQLDGAG